MNLSVLFLLFIIYSFLGWTIEIIYTFLKDKTIVNRGFLIGPYCPIYGTGCILMILLLNRYIDDIVVLFVMSIVICAFLEYVTSYTLEKLFKARWWDYSDRKFNINGRICLETLVPFGLLGCFLMYILNPFVSGLFLKLPSNILFGLSVFVFIIFFIDNIVSFSIITKIHVSSKNIIMDNTEEITKKVREYISRNSKFGKRLMKSFPGIKILKEKYEKRSK